MQANARSTRLTIPIMFVLAALLASVVGSFALSRAYAMGSTVSQAFDQAAKDTGVPVSLLKALCYMEGHLSDHGGTPSRDGGYSCMHLTQGGTYDTKERSDNPTLARHHIVSAQISHVDTLDQAAKELGVSPQLLKTDLATSIRGGAVILRDDALQVSKTHTLPKSLAGWYGAVATYSNATTRSTALMYADALYKILNSGFSATTDTGEMVTLTSQVVSADKVTATGVKGTTSLPAGCTNDGNTDYPGAIDCILDPNTYDCNVVPNNAPCTYEDANRPTDLPVQFVTIHDIEGTAQEALNVFQNPTSSVSIHYIVDSDGTVYQMVHDKDIAYHAGNYWYNQRAIGIEHAGFDATGFQWYNATQYLASAQLTAYLLQKFNIPLDRSFVIGHENVPSPFLALAPNHVDPGPYWLWDYYFALIHQQGVQYPAWNDAAHTITLHPPTDQRPYNKNGTETPANFNFFYLYNGPSTASGLIPQGGSSSDVTDVTNNVGPDVSYYYITKVKDPAGTGDTLYEIWYGEEDHAHDVKPSRFADAKLAWLAVPPDTAGKGQGTIVALTGSSSNNGNAEIYGRPVTNEKYHIGDASSNSVFVSVYTEIEYQTTNQWYEINYNHRQAWVPAAEVTVVSGSIK
ncbi:MAG: N-acetylmuramoyl-L-alanine amidase [Ktedonobacteraceae bacterium]